MKSIFCFMLFLLGMTGLHAQTTLQVVTKSIQNKINADGLKKLSLLAEGADIELSGWNEKEIKITIQLITKNSSKETAVEDLKAMKVVQEKIGNTYFIRNYLAIQKGDSKPTSNFKAKYIIYLPKDLLLSVTNSFGDIRIKGIDANIQLNTKFCKTEIAASHSSLDLDMYFGEMDIQSQLREVKIKGDHARIIMGVHPGSLEARLTSGYFYCEPAASNQSFRIITEKGEVKLKPQNLGSFGYIVSSEHSDLNLPENFKADKKKKNYNINPDKTSKIIININYGILNIQ